MGKTHYVSDLVNRRMNMAKRVYTISVSRDRNLRQSAATYGNLPAPITLPSTITTCTVTVRKEGRRSAYMDF